MVLLMTLKPRCTPIIWCGLLSIPFLGQRLKAHNWIGILVLSGGLVIKVTGVRYHPDHQQHKQ